MIYFGVLGLIGIIIFGPLTIVSMITKNGKFKSNLAITLLSLVVCIGGLEIGSEGYKIEEPVKELIE